jgi:membrane-associated protein
MEWLNQLKHIIDPSTLVNLGYVAIGAIIFAESGLLVGFLFPGDSLLILAGVAAAAGKLQILPLIILVFLAAFLGDQVGYWTGKKFGKAIFSRKNSRFFHPGYVTQSEDFFAKHGHKTIILARFVPIVRTFTPILAGVGSMHYKTFITYNFIGALLWGVGVTSLGYIVGKSIPADILEKYIYAFVGVIIVLSIIPAYKHIVAARQSKKL